MIHSCVNSISLILNVKGRDEHSGNFVGSRYEVSCLSLPGELDVDVEARRELGQHLERVVDVLLVVGQEAFICRNQRLHAEHETRPHHVVRWAFYHQLLDHDLHVLVA